MKPAFPILRLLSEVLLGIALAESAIMVLLPIITPDLGPFAKILLDSATLVVVAGPLLLWRIRAALRRGSRPESHTVCGSDPPIANVSRLIYFSSLGALAVGVLWSLLGAWQVNDGIRASASADFDRLTQQIKTETTQRLKKYTDGLFGIRSLYEASKTVERGEFRSYFAPELMQREFAGDYSFGFIRRVAREDIDAFVSAQRIDDAPDFSIRSTGSAPDLLPVQFVEPLERNAAMVGYDVGTDPIARAGAVAAMRTGEPTLTGRIALPGVRTSSPAFMYLLPIFRKGMPHGTPEERRASLEGWAFTILAVADMMTDLTAETDGRVDVEIYDGNEPSPSDLLYDSDNIPDAIGPAATSGLFQSASFSTRVAVELGGRNWSLWIRTTPIFETAVDREVPILVGIGGVCISALLAIIVWSMGSRWTVALRLAADMTADLRASEALSRKTLAELAAYRTALDGQTIIGVTDLDGILLDVNEPFCRASGYDRQELIGAHTRLFNSGHHPPEFFAEMWQVITAGNVWRGEVCNRCKDGSLRWLDTTIGPMRDSAGLLIGYITVRNDVTTRKQVETELRQARDKLEERVMARTAQLVEAKHLAEEASRAKSEFLAQMSHEIRTPLNGVVGMIDLVSGSRLSEEQKRFIGMARTAAGSLLSIINDILDFSKIEAGKLELVPSEFDLCQLVEEIMAMQATTAASKGLELACFVHPSVPDRVLGDADRVRQILVNLVNNATKFTERGSVILRVVLDSVTDEVLTIRFTVTDTGVGIPPDRVNRLFKAFSQADASTTKVYGGTGLGLAISKRLAELMGGSIGVESEFGQGSTFWVTCVLNAPQQQGGLTKPPVRHRFDPRTWRVLAVHHDAAKREVLGDQLANWGFGVGTAASGEGALATLAEAAGQGTPFRVALLNAEMPGMDGYELAEAIRSMPELSTTVLMIMLAPETHVSPGRLKAMGFSGHITKPVRQSRLLDAIMDAVSTDGYRAAPEELPPPGDSGCRPFEQQPEFGVGLRLLVAEDNEINQIVATEVLSRSGIRCDVVDTGQAAVEAVKRERYDLVLMDCQMPVMDGFDATREIRALENRRGVASSGGSRLPIVALTANAMRGDRERCLEAGMDAYVSKPIDPTELLKTIRRLLGNQPQAADAA